MSTREQLVQVFEDTIRFLTSDPQLKEATAASLADVELYAEGDTPALPENAKRFDTGISVTKERSFEAAMRLRKEFPDARITVHNFASATNPGGGVTKGSRAQEEALCRCSTLYPTLATQWLWDSYYRFHRDRHDVCYTDACIYSPDIVICKTDTDLPERMPPEDWVTVDVLTCAAPNLRTIPHNPMNPGTGKPVKLSADELYALHVRRARHMLSVAAANGAEVLVLGAFGCGAFCNDPHVVAEAYKAVLAEFEGVFGQITFAVYCSPREMENYQAFAEAFGA